jgi:putative two-component system response regulator
MNHRPPAPKPGGKIVLADDFEANLNLLGRLLEREGYSVYTASDGLAAWDLVISEMPDLVVTDVLMPGIDGFELCRRVKKNPATRLTPVVLVTSLAERGCRIDGINAGADDFLTKPVDLLELQARVRSLMNLKRFTDDLDSADSMILSLGLIVEARDGHTGDHCQRMAAYAAAFGAHLELSSDDIAALHRGGYLHDIGKVGIPDSILLKPGRLTAAEFETMKGHTIIGDALCGDLRLLRPVRPIARHHHERCDGSGYPDGLCGDGIPLLAQITGIVDVFDALTSDRPYRKALSETSALEELRQEARRGWRRADLVDEFTAICVDGRLKQLVEDAVPPVAFSAPAALSLR